MSRKKEAPEPSPVDSGAAEQRQDYCGIIPLNPYYMISRGLQIRKTLIYEGENPVFWVRDWITTNKPTVAVC
ncbi:MAG: hypothetical protein BBJ60_05600 [Desulfobacterales bacterium S7086C20]|nr:MAG: hypothetical protein BBJ60_05600 [Desulfobacterales bacterium S7086C20]